MAYSWQDGLLNGVALPENSDIAPLATLTASDDGGVGAVSYGITTYSYGHYLFTIDNNGVLSPTSYLRDYEYNLLDYASVSRHFSAVVNAYSADGTVQASRLFVLTLQDVDEPTKWVSTPSTGVTMIENNLENIGPVFFNAIDGDGVDVTYSLSGTDEAYFRIDESSGGLYARSSFDFESSHGIFYSVIVNANSVDGSAGVSQTFILTVQDRALDIRWAANGNPSSATVGEFDAKHGLSLANFTVTVSNGYDGHFSYWLSDNVDASFTMDRNGTLRVRLDRDYETDDPSHQYTVLVHTGIRNVHGSLSQLFILSVANEDEFATGWVGSQSSGVRLAENNPENIGPVFFNATDGDGVDVTYSLSGTDEAYFRIDESSGGLYARSSFDFESSHGIFYSVIVNANSVDGSAGVSQLVILTITDDVSDNVGNTSTGWQNGGNPSGGSLVENNNIGASLADFGATDGDAGATVTYGLASGSDAAYFSINAADGVLSVRVRADFENAAVVSHNHRYSVVVNARADDNGPAISQTFILTITDDVSDNPVVNQPTGWQNGGNPSGGSLVENNNIGASLADFGATDGNAGATVTYSLASGSDASYFSINAADGVLSLRVRADFENASVVSHNHRYSVVVVASSTDASPAINQLFILTITDDVSDNPVVNQPTGWQNGGNPSGGSLVENNNIGASLADFGATDGDGVAVTYSLAAGSDTAYFSINAADGVLSLRVRADFENASVVSHNHRYSVAVVASSTDASPAINQLFILTITDDVSDNPVVNQPTGWQNGGNPSGGSLVENNNIGASLADFGATDGDAGATVTYSLASGSDTAYFSINAADGVLSLRVRADYENAAVVSHNHRYSVVVVASSTDASPAINQLFILTITDDVSDNAVVNQPTGWQNGGNPSGTAIAENNNIGASLADFGATDGDAGATVTYSLASGSDTAYFSINAASGILSVRSQFDFENSAVASHNHRYSVVVVASSTDASPAISQLYVLTVTDDVSDNAVVNQPTGWQNGGNPSGGSLVENNNIGASLADFGATDGNAGATVTYSLASGSDAAYFSINAADGVLSLRVRADFENAAVVSHNHRYSVVVNATSTDGSPAISQTFILTITDVAEPTTWQNNGNPSGVALAENNNIGASLADFGATDGDGVAVTYGLSGTDATYFNINTTTGVLTAKSAFDFEDTNHGTLYSVIVNANSVDASPAISQLYVLTVTDDVSDNAVVNQPTGWQNGGNPSGGSLVENNNIGASLADFGATDGDGVAVTYGLSGADNVYFEINTTTGVLSAKSEFNFEDLSHADGRYSVVVNATSLDASSITQTFVLTITDVAEPTNWQTNGNPSGIAIVENNAVGLGPIVFNATDGDGVAVTYSLSGDDAVYFTIAPYDGGGGLYLKSSLDFEDTNHGTLYSVVVNANSVDASPAISQLYVLTVTDDVSDNDVGQPTGWQNGGNPSGGSLVENNTVGASLADFGATDGDGVAVTYSLAAGSDAVYFSINAADGVLSLRVRADFENAAVVSHNHRYSVVVVASSTDASAAITQLFILTITDVAEPTNWQTNGNPSSGVLEENTIVNTNTGITVADFNAIDGDGTVVTYGLQAGNDSAYFSINADTGALLTRSMFDYEASDVVARNFLYSVVVIADSIDDSPAISQMFVLSISNFDEYGTAWEADSPGLNAIVRISENNSIGMSLADFNATDRDIVAVTYSLSGANDDYFNLDSTTGVLTAKSVFDFEAVRDEGNLYMVTVTATSTNGNSSVVRDLIVEVGNVLEPMMWESDGNPSGATISENNNITVPVADFNAIYGDSPFATITYSIQQAGTDASGFAFFNIDTTNGELFLNESIDYENTSVAARNHRYSVVAVATSTDGSAVSQMFILTIANSYENSNNLGWANNGNPDGATIAENNAIGLLLADFENINIPSGILVSYGLAGEDVNYFSINMFAGGLSVRSQFDYEDPNVVSHNHRYSVVVFADTNDDTTPLSQLFVLTIANIDENPASPQFTSAGQPTGNRIDENNAVNTSVADFNHVQNNLPAGVFGTYALTGDSTDYFQINSQSGWITLISSLDYESEYGQSIDNRYSMVVVVNRTDDTAPISRLFILTVNDVDEYDPVWLSQPQPLDNSNYLPDGTPRAINIEESGITNLGTSTGGVAGGAAAGTQVAKFAATDADGTDDVTYSLTGGDATYFSIDANGGLFVRSHLDFEDGGHGTVYSVVVNAASTNGDASLSNLFILSLTDVDVPIYWFEIPSNGNLAENTAAGTNLDGDFIAADGDGNAAPSPSYSLAGNDGHYFDITYSPTLPFGSTARLVAKSVFDYEDQDVINHNRRYSIQVIAHSTENNDTADISTLFVVTITNIFENPASHGFTSGGRPDGVTILENEVPGPVLADFDHVQSTLPVGVIGTYALTGDSADYFNINTQNGQITLKYGIDSESDYSQSVNNRYSMAVVVNRTDDTTPVSSLFIVTVTNIDNTRTWSNNPPDGTAIEENNSINVLLADFDNRNSPVNITYGLLGDDVDYFNINLSNGRLTLLSSLDYENQDVIDRNHRYSVIIVANATTEGTAITRLFVLTINDFSNTTAFSAGGDGVTIAENNVVGFDASDRIDDFGNDGATVSITYGLSGDSADYFSVGAITGWLFVTSSFDYESDYGQSINNRYSVIITANATVEGTAISRTYILTINNIDNTGGWSNSGGDNPAGVVINENNTVGLSVADFDNFLGLGGALTTYGLSGDAADYFNIDTVVGRLTLTSSLDYESEHGQSINNRYSVIITANANVEGTAISRTYILTIYNVDNTTNWNGDTITGKAIDENRGAGLNLWHFRNDGDLPAGVTMTYAISGDAVDYFTITNDVNAFGNFGRLRAKNSFDYESDYGQENNNRYSVVVTAAATVEGTAISRVFILTINDVSNTNAFNSDTPTGRALNENNAIGGLYNFNNDGALPSGVSITYGLSGDNTSFLNILPTTGHVSTEHVFDYESPYGQLINNRYSAIITANATVDGTAISRVYILTINNIDNTNGWNSDTPTGRAVNENNSSVLALADFDNDGALPNGVAITYGISGDNTSFFNIGITSGNLIATSSFDYESDYGQSINNRYSVIVTANATGDEGTPISRVYILTINDVDNTLTWTQPIIGIGGNPDGRALNENITIGQSVADFDTSSVSGGASITYGLSGSNANYFNINNNGNLFTQSAFDYESTYGQSIDNRYSIIVTAAATEEGTAISRTFILTINDVDNSLTWTQAIIGVGGNPDGRIINENPPIGLSVADFDTSSASGGSITYGLSGSNADYFSLAATTGWLFVTSSFDYESTYGLSINNRYSIIVTANTTIEGDTAISRTYILTINDVNNTTAFTAGGNGRAIAENNVVGFDFGDRITDFGNSQPAGINITYGLSGDSADYFSLAATTGWLFVTSSLDYESTHGQSISNRYSVVITANATVEGDAISRTYILTVNDVNNTNNWASDTSNGRALNENNTASQRLWDFRQVGPLPSGTITYGLAGGDTSYFRIDNIIDSNGNGYGRLRVTASFDYESTHGQNINNRYSVIVAANANEEGNAISRTYILTINDINNTNNWASNTSNGKAINENNGTGSLWDFRQVGPLPSGTITYGLSGGDASYFSINNTIDSNGNGFGRLRVTASLDYESTYGQSINNRYSVVVVANANEEGTPISRTYILTINDINNTNNWASNTSNGRALNENNNVSQRLWDFRQVGPLPSGTITYGLSGGDASYFSINNTIDSNGNGFGRLFATASFDYESTYGQSINNRYSVVVTANANEEGNAISRTYILTINNTSGGLEPDDPLPAPPVGLNGKVLFDGTTDMVGGISDGIDNEGLIIIGNDLVATQYSDGAETNLILNNIENFETSFVGYTDADGNDQNHWFFVRDDATDNTGHIVFDADGLDVNLESLSSGGATTTPDQINLLAGLNFGNDGDFNKPDDLDLNLNGNNAASLTHDQFLALIGGSNNLDFI